ncbi:TIGR03943 family putative permease subunit [Paenibacillus sp.]|uniref:TIGR03943 family putative permease subunit n=1 Tax=Paenibacillus sp. TaxID=58172 RepID=UPI002D302418|nr:TIGR03943 family protein [Paenibacillus sp.]HZG86868.1 TIGR03943 family protein [Paenibacillus sp.]
MAHRLLRAGVSAGFSFYIVYLVKNDLLHLYIAPKMELYVKLSAVVFVMFAVFQLYSAFATLRGQPLDCGCGHPPSKSFWRNTAAYGLLIAPLLMGYFLPDSALGSALVDKKGIVLSANNAAGAKSAASSAPAPSPEQAGAMSDEQLLASFQTGELYEDQYAPLAVQLIQQDPIVVRDDAFLEITTTIDLFSDRFVGKRVQIEGFVYRNEDMAQDQLVIARMAMECCSADSTPYGFLIQYPKASTYADDTWLRVAGTLNTVDWDGYRISMIEADTIQPIEAPETPYVYPNYDALDIVN